MAMTSLCYGSRVTETGGVDFGCKPLRCCCRGIVAAAISGVRGWHLLAAENDKPQSTINWQQLQH